MITLRNSYRVDMNSSAGKGVAIAAMFPPELVQDIIAAVNTYGAGLPAVTSQFANENAIPQPFSCLSDIYIKNEDVVPLIVGMQTISLYSMRSGWGNDQYRDIISKAFSIPKEMAAAYANKIETLDKMLIDTNNDGQATMLETASANIKEGFRQAWNWMVGGLPIESLKWDQNQAGDVDFLLEFRSLGQVIQELNDRTRLIAGGARINAGAYLRTGTGTGDVMDDRYTGDPEIGDPEVSADYEVGDVFGNIGRPNLPKSVFGGLAPLAMFGKVASYQKAQKMINQSLTPEVVANKITREEASRRCSPAAARVGNVIDSIRKANPTKVAVLGALGGAGAFTIGKLAANALKGKGLSLGDIDQDMYGEVIGDIQQDHGPELAQAWLTGDVDTVARHILTEAVNFNPETASASTMGEVIDDLAETGEVDDDDIETGGLFTRWKLARAERKLGRKVRKSKKRESKLRAKQMREARLAALREAAAQADSGYYNPNEGEESNDFTAETSSQNEGDGSMLDAGVGVDPFM